MRDSQDAEEFIQETIERLLATARAEDTLPAAGDLDMAVMYLRHYLRHYLRRRTRPGSNR